MTTTMNASEMTWETIVDFPGAADVKVLRNDGPRKAKTMLVRLHAGNKTRPHSHVGTVQHYVLEGEYESEGEIFSSGMYRLFSEHADVPELTTRNGVKVLMIYDPIG